MKVNELIKILENYPEDYEVILSQDSEGNNYHRLHVSGIVPAQHRVDSTYYVDIWQSGDTEVYNENCVVFYP